MRPASKRSGGESCLPTGYGHYRISWVMDYYYADTRYRTPRVFHRITDEKGARRFCRKWGIQFHEGKP